MFRRQNNIESTSLNRTRGTLSQIASLATFVVLFASIGQAQSTGTLTMSIGPPGPSPLDYTLGRNLTQTAEDGSPGKVTSPYPGPGEKSGITLPGGWDLGQHSTAENRQYLNEYNASLPPGEGPLTPGQIDSLVNASGKRGSKASDYEDEHNLDDIDFSSKQIEKLFLTAYAHSFSRTEDVLTEESHKIGMTVDEFNKLDPRIRAVLVDQIHNGIFNWQRVKKAVRKNDLKKLRNLLNQDHSQWKKKNYHRIEQELKFLDKPLPHADGGPASSEQLIFDDTVPKATAGRRAASPGGYAYDEDRVADPVDKSGTPQNPSPDDVPPVASTNPSDGDGPLPSDPRLAANSPAIDGPASPDQPDPDDDVQPDPASNADPAASNGPNGSGGGGPGGGASPTPTPFPLPTNPTNGSLSPPANSTAAAPPSSGNPVSALQSSRAARQSTTKNGATRSSQLVFDDNAPKASNLNNATSTSGYKYDESRAAGPVGSSNSSLDPHFFEAKPTSAQANSPAKTAAGRYYAPATPQAPGAGNVASALKSNAGLARQLPATTRPAATPARPITPASTKTASVGTPTAAAKSPAAALATRATTVPPRTSAASVNPPRPVVQASRNRTAPQSRPGQPGKLSAEGAVPALRPSAAARQSAAKVGYPIPGRSNATHVNNFPALGSKAPAMLRPPTPGAPRARYLSALSNPVRTVAAPSAGQLRAASNRLSRVPQSYAGLSGTALAKNRQTYSSVHANHGEPAVRPTYPSHRVHSTQHHAQHHMHHPAHHTHHTHHAYHSHHSHHHRR